MNKNNAKDYLPLVQALSEGRVIQMFSGGVWRDLGAEAEMFIDDSITYRIKPEPKVVYAVLNKAGGVHACFSNEANARRTAETYTSMTYKKFVEVVE